MNGNTETARKAAQEMVEINQTGSKQPNALKRDMVNEGLYHAVVEGGHHSQTLSDEEVDYLVRQLATDGITKVEEIANGNIPVGDA